MPLLPLLLETEESVSNLDYCGAVVVLFWELSSHTSIEIAERY